MCRLLVGLPRQPGPPPSMSARYCLPDTSFRTAAVSSLGPLLCRSDIQALEKLLDEQLKPVQGHAGHSPPQSPSRLRLPPSSRASPAKAVVPVQLHFAATQPLSPAAASPNRATPSKNTSSEERKEANELDTPSLLYRSRRFLTPKSEDLSFSGQGVTAKDERYISILTTSALTQSCLLLCLYTVEDHTKMSQRQSISSLPHGSTGDWMSEVNLRWLRKRISQCWSVPVPEVRGCVP